MCLVFVCRAASSEGLVDWRQLPGEEPAVGVGPTAHASHREGPHELGRERAERTHLHALYDHVRTRQLQVARRHLHGPPQLHLWARLVTQPCAPFDQREKYNFGMSWAASLTNWHLISAAALGSWLDISRSFCESLTQYWTWFRTSWRAAVNHTEEWRHASLRATPKIFNQPASHFELSLDRSEIYSNWI